MPITADAVGKSGLLLAAEAGSVVAGVAGVADSQWGAVGIGAAGLVGVFSILVRDRRAEEEIRDDLRAVIDEARSEAREERERARRAEARLLEAGIPVPGDGPGLPSSS